MPARSVKVLDSTLEESSLAHGADSTLADQFGFLFAGEMTKGEKPLIPFTPNEGPQTAAMLTDADELLFGGAAGGSKTYLLIGLACTEHHRTIIFRSEYEELKSIIDELERLVVSPGNGSYNSIHRRFKLDDGRMIELGGLKDPGSEKKFQGRPHDFLAFDELANIRRDQYLFLQTWLRSAQPGQRCRIIATTNPPSSSEGLWIIERWAPWLDPKHHNPAKDGELRWYATNSKGDDVECVGPNEVVDPTDPTKTLTPMSRTFIRAKVADNPYYAGTRYEIILNNLPEPLRSQMKDGVFGVSFNDNAYQVIPTHYVDAAMGKWTEDGAHGRPMGVMGIDVARGGEAKTVFAKKHGNWIDRLVKYKGIETPDGDSVAAFAIQHIQPGTTVNIDASGVGGDAFTACKRLMGAKENGGRVRGIWFQEKSERSEKSGLYDFLNLRAEAWWGLREALNPLGENPLILPPDPELKADLCAPRWKPHGSTSLKIESKEDLEKRLNRSPDCGDALAYACMDDSVNPIASVETTKLEITPESQQPGVIKGEGNSVLVIRDPSTMRRPWG